MEQLSIRFWIGDGELVAFHFFVSDRSLLNGSMAISSRLVCLPKKLLMRL